MFSRQTVFQASTILILAALLSRVLGFVREMVIAHFLGASLTYDVFLVSLTFPSMLASIFLYTLPSVFIPVYMKEKISQGDDSAWTYFLNFLNIFACISFLVSISLFSFAPFVIRSYAPSLNSEQLVQAIRLLRVLSAIVFFAGLFTIFKSVLNANKHFLLPAIAPLFLNVMTIISVIFLTNSMAALALALGWLIGYFFQLLTVFWIFTKSRPPYKFFIDVHDRLLKNTFSALLLITIVETIGQLNVVIDRSFVAFLPEGSISALSYASTLNHLPIAVLGITMATSIFPSLAEYAANKDKKNLIQLYSKGVRFVLAITIPIALILFFFAGEIVTLLFQRGAFNQHATALTSSALKMLTIGLAAFVVHVILIKIFYAMNNNVTLLISTFFALILKVVLSIWLVKIFMLQGLALSTSLAAIFNVTLLSLLLRKKIGNIDGKRIVFTLVKISVLSIISFGIGRLAINYMGGISLIFRIGFAIGLGSIIFVSLVFIFKVEEFVVLSKKIAQTIEDQL
ncbi:MAG: murein biosynthesis integral membrane protein MurJ [Calditrichaeota bacterium]|nr:murein biosynthesis integral membrane protein MurJ [Calditrichota bacterium]